MCADNLDFADAEEGQLAKDKRSPEGGSEKQYESDGE
jgi:hypothetical protein